MKPFLQQVAEVYSECEYDNIANYCFVFPNKRSAAFFEYYLQRAMSKKGVSFMPEITNITDFVGSFSDLIQANRYDMLFTLFNEYDKMEGVEANFDQFVFWGDMILNDFADVDRYMINPDEIFGNVKKLREISSNYLTEEQIEIIKRFWGEDRSSDSVNDFWKHLPHEDKETRKKFTKLWEVLQPLYHQFTESLERRHLATSGMLYRKAAESLSRFSSYQPPMDRYIFVGFNALSTSEIKIFSRLKAMGRADFYWDCNSPALAADMRGARFVRRNMKELPSRYPLPEEQRNGMPDITIIGVPSNVGQLKVAGEMLREWTKKDTADENKSVISNPENAIDTAVVLPDESLLIPMIHSVPEEIKDINVTMGFPMRLSPMAGLVRTIISLQLRSRIVRDTRVFFYEDIKTLLSTPSIRGLAPANCARMEALIESQNLFTIPATLLLDTIPELAPIFTPLADNDSIDEIGNYIFNLCRFLSDEVAPAELFSASHSSEETVPDTDDDSTVARVQSKRIQHQFIDSYITATQELIDAAKQYNIKMNGGSFFRLLERAIGSDTVNFSGTPLKGLQIMGVLETRALDFKNIIMTSMNERIFPQRHYSRSFIPDALRHGYGMATIDFQESIYAYYFYRLISRAENVTLIYDARTSSGLRSSEMSRYLSQLLYIFGQGKIKHLLKVYNAHPSSTQPISVVKTKEILAKLDQYKYGVGNRALSASSINNYINCPLQFYLQNVEHLNTENEITDYMDFSTFGTIFHNVLQGVFEGSDIDEEKHPIPVNITESYIDDWLKNDGLRIEKLIVRNINRCHHRINDPEKINQPLVGEALILSNVIKAAVMAILEHDKKLAPIQFIAAEYKIEGKLTVGDYDVNILQFIDRVDRVMVEGEQRLRFIDYKTGGDVTNAGSVATLFNINAIPERPKAILQLLLYCEVYCQNIKDEPIMPIIYKMLDVKSNGIQNIKINRTEVTNFKDFREEFMQNLGEVINEIFNPDVPFVQTNNTHNCKFCNFKPMCGRK